jgi:hypothetical protein
VKGTRLWNQPRSPLIQGRSRRERPFWADWLAAVSIGVVVGAVVAGTLLAPAGVAFLTAVTSAAARIVPGAAVGAAGGVWVASGFGWHPRWVSGAIASAIVAVGATWLLNAL